MQLWLDKADGRVEHLHAGAAAVAPHGHLDWLDPSVSALDDVVSVPGKPDRPDVGDHQDSAPAPGAVHLLLVTLLTLPAVPATPVRAVRATRRLVGRRPTVLLPPPRWTAPAA